ncbi:MAG TPA: hypothetical protein VGN80_09820 [Devosiaceae bacterium]|jgi:hypothetical protein|nr:hypothetical protein [Devosiaceae bacterium]
MDFAEIEALLGFALPASARQYPAWWSNDPSAGRQASAWLTAGWKTQELDLGNETVMFSRAQATPRAPSAPAHEAGPRSSTDQTRIEIAFSWQPMGALSIDASGKLAFPDVPSAAGIYRFRVRSEQGQKCYFGEGDQLRRRFSHYRNPGPSQLTNIRLNELIVETIQVGGSVQVDVIAAETSMTITGQAAVSISHKNRCGGCSRTRRSLQTGTSRALIDSVLVKLRLQQDDPTVGRQRIENDVQAVAALMGICPADLRPDRLSGVRIALGGVGDDRWSWARRG